MAVAPPTNGHGERPGPGGSPGSAPPAESVELVEPPATSEVADVLVPGAAVVGLPLVAVGFPVVDLPEVGGAGLCVVDAAGPSPTVGVGCGFGRVGLPLVGGVFEPDPEWNDQPSNPPRITVRFCAPLLL